MQRLSRRQYLGAMAATGVGLVAGCLGDDSGGGDTVDDLPIPTLGDDDAPVTMTVYEDFACPHCQTFERDIFPDIYSQYIEPGDVRFRRRDFPIPVSNWSYPIASGMRAIQDGADDAAFFDAVEVIYTHQDSYSFGVIENVGDEVADLGSEARSAAEDETYRPVVEDDRSAGQDAGIEGTPGVLVEGTVLGSYDFNTIASAIDGQL